jgi:hypothetical protein
MRKLKRFKQLKAEQRNLLLRVFVTVVVARVSLCLLSVGTTRRVTTRLAAGVRAGSVEQVAWAVKAACRFVPGATCLSQAVAAQAILARSGISSQVEVGVSKKERCFQAHAWVTCQGKVVLGGRQTEQYNSLLVWEPQE